MEQTSSPAYLWLIGCEYDASLRAYRNPIVSFLEFCLQHGYPVGETGKHRFLAHMNKKMVAGVGRFLSVYAFLNAPPLQSLMAWEKQPQLGWYNLDELIRYWAWHRPPIPVLMGRHAIWKTLVHWCDYLKGDHRGPLQVDWIGDYLQYLRKKGHSAWLLNLRQRAIQAWAGWLADQNHRLALDAESLSTLHAIRFYQFDSLTGCQPEGQVPDEQRLPEYYRQYMGVQLVQAWLERGFSFAILPCLTLQSVGYIHPEGIFLKLPSPLRGQRQLTEREIALYFHYVNHLKLTDLEDQKMLFPDWDQLWPVCQRYLQQQRRSKKDENEWEQHQWKQEGRLLLEGLRLRYPYVNQAGSNSGHRSD